jgi:hypothetical protein
MKQLEGAAQASNISVERAVQNIEDGLGSSPPSNKSKNS